MERRENIAYPVHLNLFITLQSLKRHDFKDFSESLFSLIFCTFGDLITGIIMGVSTSSLQALPALLILIPPAIGMRGNIFASLGSRLGTYLHTGQISPSFRGKILSQNVSSSFILSISMSFYLGLLATFTANFLGMEVKAIDMILISLIGGVLSAFFMLAFTIATAFFSYRLGWDPDNVTTPLITLVGDVITLPLLFFSMSFILIINYQQKMLLFAFFIILGIISVILPFSKISIPYCKRIVMESIPILLACGLLSTFSGSLLGGSFKGLIGIAGILTMVPAFLEDGGAIGGILAARFSSALHLGSMHYSKFPPKKAQKMFLSMHVIGLVVFSLIGIFAYIISIVVGIDVLPVHEMVIVSVIAGELLIVVVNFVAYYTSITSFKFGLDPDNVTIPIITSIMDILGTACLIAVLLLFGII
ncbi:MAG: hypothetical protein DRN29_07515 [Thermoplasmata archaeon]|nr:MAG: hypothetical protein DRN29_07515 [Thermoplasmata archaeon]